MSIRVGCDVSAISRMKDLMSQPDVIHKIFHQSESTRFEAVHLAKIFTLKEAAFKALGLKSNSWLLIEVTFAPDRKPQLHLSPDLGLSSNTSLACSTSHDGDLAFGVVVVAE